MSKLDDAPTAALTKPVSEQLGFDQIEAEYGTPKKRTSYVWVSTNRYGFRDLVIKVGGRCKVKRSDFEEWLESRRIGGKAP